MCDTCLPPWITKDEINQLCRRFPLVMNRKNRKLKLMQFAYGRFKHKSRNYAALLNAIRADIRRHYNV